MTEDSCPPAPLMAVLKYNRRFTRQCLLVFEVVDPSGVLLTISSESVK